MSCYNKKSFTYFSILWEVILTMEAIKEKTQFTSSSKQKRNNQDGKIGGLSHKTHQVSHNCAICRTEYLLVDFKSSRICDECVQYIKENC